jgi:poly(A) polymerase
VNARKAAVAIVKRLRAAGHVAYFAGGCVRDELLGLNPTDYDVATDAAPTRIGELFPRATEVGAAFGVMLVHEHKVSIEVATFREEWGYSDNRRPDRVRFADAQRDARRRDFTINALFLDPLGAQGAPIEGLAQPQGQVIDFVGGVDDMRARIVRAVGDPGERLAEDHLRALRAVRFTARLGFALDAFTAAAVRAHAVKLAGVSRERIGEELRRMLAPPTRAQAVRLLEELALDAPTLTEEALSGGDRRTIAALPPDAGFPLALAAWSLDRLDARAGGLASGADVQGACEDVVSRWRAALCLSNADRDEMLGVLRTLAALQTRWSALGVAGQKRLAASRWFAPASVLLAARDPAGAAGVAAREAELRAAHGGVAPPPLLTGDTLVAMGMAPGPEVGRVIDAVYDAQLEGRVKTAEEAARMASSLAGLG